MKRRVLETVNEQMEKKQKPDTDSSIAQLPTSPDALRADAAEARMTVQLMAEVNSPTRARDSSLESRGVTINSSVA